MESRCPTETCMLMQDTPGPRVPEGAGGGEQGSEGGEGLLVEGSV